ncbi:MAG: phosphate--nucleotide phosphotransferase [Xanthomonadales bacterium]|nr:phosphate--nucleotide phosphotransferase [Xanthomonadales bacterium]
MPDFDSDASRRHLVPFDGNFSLADFPTSIDELPAKKVLKNELEDLVEELHDLQRVLYADGRYAVLAVFQAMDAAGKDSTIRKVFSGVNPAGFRVEAFGVPSERERKHDFLWRCARALPERGKIGIFNRSHYEECLVVRVKPELLEGQNLPHVDPATIWDERLESIRQWERHLARNGTVIVKFWLNVSMEEQKNRFLRRLDRADKHWKFSAKDLDDRARWPEYMHAYQEALRRTSRDFAPWYAIPADSKPYMRVAVARTMVNTLRRLDLSHPELSEDERRALTASRNRLVSPD